MVLVDCIVINSISLKLKRVGFEFRFYFYIVLWFYVMFFKKFVEIYFFYYNIGIKLFYKCGGKN